MATDEFSNKMTDFALDIFRQVALAKNVVFSPTSMALALAMAHLGAQGETRTQINRRLFGNLTDAQVLLGSFLGQLKSN